MRINNCWIYLFLLAFVIGGVSSCTKTPPPQFSPQEVAIAWADLTLHVTKNTPANSPTFASRCLAYIGVTMYESIVHGFPTYNSLAGQLQGLDQLPQPDASKTYDWIISLNAGQAEMLRTIYQQTADSNKVRIDSLEEIIYQSSLAKLDDYSIAERSAAYGRSIAKAIYEWSKSDGGHRAYLKNFDKELIHPEFLGSWKPPLFAQSFSHHPLHPYWGKNRTFVTENADLANPEIIPYDTMPGSPYYEQFREVYEKEKVLTQEEKEAAIWWSDDPDDTFTPPGHSYYLASLVLREKQPSLIACAETYARVGLAVADAFILCWRWKYHFFSERPNTFVPQFIDEEWESFWPDPPFPSFPSGHAIQAAASTTVLIDLYGDQFTFIDRAHEGRERDEYRDTDFVNRHFDSFSDLARETADSRFYGGIHTHQDNEVGLEQGAIIAEHVNDLAWRSQEYILENE